MWRPSVRTVVGLDIESDYVAVVEAKAGSVAVDRAAIAPLAADIVRDGEVLDPAALTEILKRLFAENDFGKRVRIGVANQKVVVRTIDLPPITDAKQIASAVRFQAQEQLPMPIDQAVLEHQSLGIVGTPDGPKARVVLVAARRDMLEPLLSAVRGAGLRPEGIDVSGFALIRALHRPEDGDGTAVYLHVDAAVNLALAVGTECTFTRVIGTGVDQIADELAGRCGLTREHADGWLRHVGLDAPVDEIDGDPQIVSATRNALETGTARIADGILTTLNFHSGQAGGHTAERGVLTGGAITIPGFADRLGAALGMPVLARTAVTNDGAVTGGADPSRLAVAAGLTTVEAPR